MEQPEHNPNQTELEQIGEIVSDEDTDVSRARLLLDLLEAVMPSDGVVPDGSQKAVSPFTKAESDRIKKKLFEVIERL